MYAEIAIYTAPGQRTFHYLVPHGMVVVIGQLVEVSFRTARSQGIILDLTESSPVSHAKPILDVLVAEPVVTPLQIRLAQWMAQQTLSSLSACLWLTLPPGLVKRGDTLFTLVDPDASESSASEVIALLRQRGPLRAAQIDRVLPKSRWREALRPLITAGIVRRDAILAAPDAKAHYVRTARLAIPLDRLDAAIERLKRSPKQAEVLQLLALHVSGLTFAQIAEQSGAGLDILKRLAEKGLITLNEAEHWRDPLADRNFAATPFPPLTPGQADCWTIIQQHLQALQNSQDTSDVSNPSRAFLLHGVTGSGKTEIYLRAIDQILAQGRQAIVLVPEISLVPQTVQRFASRFPGRVAVVHSDLTDGEQYDTWRRARAGDFDIVVGARSALFTPLPDVGLIVIDEEHDDSYKQSPPIPPPYYHARETAIAMMRRMRGTVILGSATPDVITSFRARRGELTYLKLPDRVVVHAEQSDKVIAAPLPPIKVIDMRQELHAGNRSMFSRALREALITTLARGEQAILFLNRRGTATFILCRDCGYVAKCPRCDMPLTYHQDPIGSTAPLRCHYCGYGGPQPVICPQCGSKRIRYFGAGTASIEEAVKNEFEGAIVLRWDRDTTQVRGTHEKLLERFAQGEANVMVGTQMIVKGLDLPRVTLVGVILADTALGLPDYRAGEHTFQLLTQAAGRAGRSSRGGQVIFQTYQPDHYAIRAASGHDYEALYAQEIVYRQELQYPPFKRLVRFQFRHTSVIHAQRDAEQVEELLRHRIAQRQMTATELIGPAPSFFGRIDDVYRWHIIARTTDPALLLAEFSPKPGCYVDIDPVEIL